MCIRDSYLGVSIGAVMMMDSSGQTPGGFKLPFNSDDLPFDLNKLPLPFDHPQVVPSGPFGKDQPDAGFF